MNDETAQFLNGGSKKKYQSINFENDPADKKLSSFDPVNSVTLTWHNINAFVEPRKAIVAGLFQKKQECKQILHNVSGEARPGQLLAIMGASGAGKTTLLNVLTSRNLRRLTVGGQVLVNGQDIGQAAVKLSAYVQQDDLFIGTLTVREHLVFQAMLRMDEKIQYEERMRRVEDVIVELGLSKSTNTIIGFPGRIKGISGGEAKRLAFASEVLTDPSLMFCDEPTSGLDSFMSRNVVTVLKSMASSGRTIVCTIHQPSSEVYELFDHLILLAEGRLAYTGKSRKALPFFERAGYACPINYNPADFFIKTLAIIPGKEDECHKKVDAICSQFMKESSSGLILSTTNSFECHAERPKHRYKSSWCKQFKVLLWRSWISLIRDPLLIKVRLMQSIVLAVLFGLVFLDQKLDAKGVMNINGALFLILINTSFQNVYSVINVFCLEQPIFLREHLSGIYRTDVYFLSKTIAETPILIFMTTVFTTIVYWMIGFNTDYRAFFICLAILILVSNTAASFGYMISCLSNSLSVALSICTPLMLPLLLFGGFYLNAGSVPVYFIWLKYISWFYYGYEVLVNNQWSEVTNITCHTSICPSNGKAVLKMLNFEEGHFWIDIGMIIVLMIFFRILAYILLLVRSSRKS